MKNLEDVINLIFPYTLLKTLRSPILFYLCIILFYFYLQFDCLILFWSPGVKYFADCFSGNRPNPFSKYFSAAAERYLPFTWSTVRQQTFPTALFRESLNFSCKENRLSVIESISNFKLFLKFLTYKCRSDMEISYFKRSKHRQSS